MPYAIDFISMIFDVLRVTRIYPSVAGFEGFLVTSSYFQTLPQLNTLIVDSRADPISMP